ncbi:chloride channel protein [Pelagibaculum spongiae]|nr:chloride channel protein [Pelagibaculum spongiae]
MNQHPIKHFLSRMAMPQLAILGICSGLITGLMISLFRMMTEWPLEALLENRFSSLPLEVRFLLPIAGAIALIMLLLILPSRWQQTWVGVGHVLQKLHLGAARLPGGNLITQILGGAIALLSGFAVGREGPEIHMGAASSSLLGQKLELPFSSLRLLVGCGAAAAVSAAFNTPLAGVVLAMEVIMLEYSFIGFVPVILASVSANLLANWLTGPALVFNQPLSSINLLLESPLVILVGISAGVLGACFTLLVRWFGRFGHWHFASRFLIVGLVTGVIAILVPQVMGTGYLLTDEILDSELAVSVLAGLLIARLLASTIALGMGIPGGAIGPILLIGAAMGSLIAGLVNSSTLGTPVDQSTYAMLGMTAMMGAVLQAPLAALMAVLELTGNPGILTPGMLALVSASLIYGPLFRQKSLFVSLLNDKNIILPLNPMEQNNIRVIALADRRFANIHPMPEFDLLQVTLSPANQWLIVKNTNSDPLALYRREDILAWLDTNDYFQEVHAAPLDLEGELMPHTSFCTMDCNTGALEVLREFYRTDCDAIVLMERSGDNYRALGVVTRHALELQLEPRH